MLLLNLIIIAFLAWVAYKLIRMLIEVIKLAVRNANQLEQEFGPDVGGAARYVFGLGQPGSAGEAVHGSKREHDDG